MLFYHNLRGKKIMLVCTLCSKRSHRTVWSRHKKGSSGASGTWALRAQISKKTQKPNLHVFKGDKYCTKCLRIVKTAYRAAQLASQPTTA